MKSEDMKPGQYYTALADHHDCLPSGMIHAVFLTGRSYKCVRLEPDSGTRTTTAILHCEQAPNEPPGATFGVLGWAIDFTPTVPTEHVNPPDPDGELYDAYEAGTVTHEMLDSYKKRHGKARPAYMG